MIIIQVTNKVFIVFLTKRNLLDTNTLNIYVPKIDKNLIAGNFAFNLNISKR